MIVCVAEDRRTHEPAVQVIIASILQHHPTIPIALFSPDPSDELVRWIAQYPTVSIRRRPPGAYGWNVKPYALLELLDEGYSRAVWLDSDMVVLRPLDALSSGQNSDVVVVTEEALWGAQREDTDAMRARGWGFPVGRILPHVLNSCVLGVTERHRTLVQRWREMLATPAYGEAQKMPFSLRPVHFGSDQDVLTALLASQEFSGIPLEIMIRGRDIVQFFGPYGYTVTERIGNLAGRKPAIYHSQGAKPWLGERKRTLSGGLSNELMELYADASPYLIAAKRLGIEFIGGNAWLKPRSYLGAISRASGFGSPSLTGLPLAAAFDVVRFIKNRRAKSRHAATAS